MIKNNSTDEFFLCEQLGPASDNENDACVGDMYIPIIAIDSVVDETYKPDFLENDVNYNVFLNALSFKHTALVKKISPPVNLYNSNGPCL